MHFQPFSQPVPYMLTNHKSCTKIGEIGPNLSLLKQCQALPHQELHGTNLSLSNLCESCAGKGFGHKAAAMSQRRST